MKHDYYYTGSDVFVYLESSQNANQIYLDKLYGIGYRESISGIPIYGIGSSEFAFISRGNTLFSVSIDVNMIHESYFTQALHFTTSVLEYIEEPSQVSFAELNSKTIDQLSTKTRNNSSSSNSSSLTPKIIKDSTMISLPRDFTIRVIYNNSQQMRVDEKSSGFLVYDCVVLSKESESYIDKDGQTIQRYSIAGKYRPL